MAFTCGSYSTTYYPVRPVAHHTPSSPLLTSPTRSVTAIHDNLKLNSVNDAKTATPLSPPASEIQVRNLGVPASSQTTGHTKSLNSPIGHSQLTPEPSSKSDLQQSEASKSKTDSLEPTNFKPEATGRADINAFIQQHRRGPGFLEVSNKHQSLLAPLIFMFIGVQGG